MTDPNNPNLIIPGPFYRVSRDMERVPVREYLDHGYEDRQDFRNAVRHIIERWGGRTGEEVDRKQHDREFYAGDESRCQLRLRFRDAPGRTVEEAWLPMYLLDPVPMPDYLLPPVIDEEQQELEEAFGF